jgi:hypothetical protein
MRRRLAVYGNKKSSTCLSAAALLHVVSVVRPILPVTITRTFYRLANGMSKLVV